MLETLGKNSHVLNLFIGSLALLTLMGFWIWFTFSPNYQGKVKGLGPEENKTSTDKFTKNPFFDKTNAGAYASYLLWCGWWLSICLSYALVDLINKDSPWGKSVLLFSIDIGSYLMIASAGAMCLGVAFTWQKLIRYSVFFLPFIWWDIVCIPLSGNMNIFYAVSPSLPLSSFASIAFGWGFVVRWRQFAYPFFVITCIYGVLQLQAYSEVFLKGELIESCKRATNEAVNTIPIYSIMSDSLSKEIGEKLESQFGNWGDVFIFLAVGKLFFFLSYLMFVKSIVSDKSLWEMQFLPSQNHISFRHSFVKWSKMSIEVLGIIVGLTLLMVKLFNPSVD